MEMAPETRPDITPTCSHCGFPLRPGSTGLRHFGTHTAHREYECLALLRAEIQRLNAALLAARPHTAHQVTQARQHDEGDYDLGLDGRPNSQRA